MSSPVDDLRTLRRLGFGGRRIFGDHGRSVTLHYRRAWRELADVVLVYSEHDAAAYRADDTFDDADPFEPVEHPVLLEEAVGTVADVVAAVRTWPHPSSLPR
ncbi:hypothetical protein [Amycolatopsis sp. NPDC059657]|uniref:hypothetical protein n=1 Tax=Amycolatopsis sp. NPDC059657 TaxID=3346899 RepID=UPI0036731A7E